ncbi:hypothetical protein K505DRAFT_11918 [Melanomma pulvis-pyrius CBS 109.77]|uniref:Uncharacterized protein n=1 Tax=Melanomma pulvis-pyrius CBS 109.77 TaxID=1314802 RepID=A0A6A6XGH9_9PLEO|nr:hypothetical protein K505DRAFT_11918 [Melanomma pulvis-pyrius CBS 109.77]
MAFLQHRNTTHQAARNIFTHRIPLPKLQSYKMPLPKRRHDGQPHHIGERPAGSQTSSSYFVSQLESRGPPSTQPKAASGVCR